jgi:YtkA-like
MNRFVRFTALTVLAVVGCGSNPGAPLDASSADELFSTCATDMHPYEAGLYVISDAGYFKITLLNSQPGPPVKGQNTWTIEVDEVATGTPLDGLDISVAPWMTAHMHGTAAVVVTPIGSGQYALKPLFLYMSGVWDVRFTVVGTLVAGGVTDLADIPTCIP